MNPAPQKVVVITGSSSGIGLLSANRPTSAIVIRWGRSDKIVLADGFYRNMPEIKQALHEHFLDAVCVAGGRAHALCITGDADRLADRALLNDRIERAVSAQPTRRPLTHISLNL